MCRLLAYLGVPVLLSDIVTRPKRSIIRQSYDARERLQTQDLPGWLNGDGFGIGWYAVEANICECCGEENGPKKEAQCRFSNPCVFTSIKPAWNSTNLHRLADKIRSPLVFAHVRAAYPGMPVSEENCHPFHSGRYMFMHNGGVAGFMQIRRRLLSGLSDELYEKVGSFHSDSAVSFAVFMKHLGASTKECSPDYLRQTLERTISEIMQAQEEVGITEASLLNFVVSDGNSIVSCRFSTKDVKPASLYYAVGKNFECSDESTDEFELIGEDGRPMVAMVASEPITNSITDWVPVPVNHMVILTKGKGKVVDVIIAPVRHGLVRVERDLTISRCLENLASGRCLHSGSALECSSAASQDPVDSDQVCIERKPRHTLTGHTKAVIALVTDDASGRLFTSSVDHSIQVWDLSAFRNIHTLIGHQRSVLNLVMHNGKLYSSAGSTIKVWDLVEYRCVTTVHWSAARCGEVLSMVCMGEWIFCGCQDGLVRSLNLTLNEVACKEPSPQDEVDEVGGSLRGAPTAAPMNHCHQVLPERRMSVPVDLANFKGSGNAAPGNKHTPTTKVPQVIHGADIALWMCSLGADGHCSGVRSVAVVGDKICSGGGDGLVIVWNMSMQPVHTLSGHQGSVSALAALDDDIVISGARDNTLRVWDLETFGCRCTLAGHTNDIVDVVVEKRFTCANASGASLPSGGGSPSGSQASNGASPRCGTLRRRFFSASVDHTIRMWCSNTWRCLRVFALCSKANIATLTVSRDLLVSGCTDGAIQTWTVEKDRRQPDRRTSMDVIESHPLSSHGRSQHSRVQVECAEKLKTLWAELESSLREFISITTISKLPKYREDCYAGAKWLGRLLESIGAEIKFATQGEMNPIVIGRIGRNPDRPTVTFYGHYDVQPASEKGWNTDPFELEAMDGYLYGRGVSANKGPVLSIIYAVKQFLCKSRSSKDGPSVNVAFLFEGEAENVSKSAFENLQKVVRPNMHWFEGTDVIVASTTSWIGETRPCLTYGMRGMINLSVKVVGPTKDLHSGIDGGVFNEPVTDLVKVLGTLVDGRNQILIPRFYEGVRNPTLAGVPARNDAMTKVDECEFSIKKYIEARGVPGINHKSAEELLLSQWCRPSLSIVDIICQKPSNFSVIPKDAEGKVCIRYVADQDHRLLKELFEKHVKYEFAKIQSPNSLQVVCRSHGSSWMGCPQSHFYKVAEHAIKAEWGEEPLYVQDGASMPVTATLEEMFNAPILQLPMSQASDMQNLANERMRLKNLGKGCNVMWRFLEELGSKWPPPRNGTSSCEKEKFGEKTANGSAR